MHSFTYSRAATVEEAVRDAATIPGCRYLAGGTTLIDVMKLGVEQPQHLIDVRHLGLDQIRWADDGGLVVGAGVTNTRFARDEQVASRFPGLARALLSGASPQLRNVATVAGNLLQKTRCHYYRDIHSPCNKRESGSGCSALAGDNRKHAILGGSHRCIAVHPSDMCVALAAFGASVRAVGRDGGRTIPIEEFYVGYGDDPVSETVLRDEELVTEIRLPHEPWFAHSTYIKARDRASYEFALSSACVAVDVHEGVVRECRIALGGIATKPWRAHRAEAVLRGQALSREGVRAAAEAELIDAQTTSQNRFKVELTKRVIEKAVTDIVGGTL